MFRKKGCGSFYEYFPKMELSNLINSITLFTDVNNLKILIDNLKKFNNLINQQKRRYASLTESEH